MTAPFDGVRSRGKSTDNATPPLRIKSADEGCWASERGDFPLRELENHHYSHVNHSKSMQTGKNK